MSTQPGSTGGNSSASASPWLAADAADFLALAALGIVKGSLDLQSLKLNGYLFHRCPPAFLFKNFVKKIIAVTKMLPIIVGM